MQEYADPILQRIEKATLELIYWEMGKESSASNFGQR